MRDIHSIGQAFKIVSGKIAKGSKKANTSSQEFFPQKMMCHKCRTPQEQQSKEDWWHCKCGSYHKGFPYKCPIKEAREEM